MALNLTGSIVSFFTSPLNALWEERNGIGNNYMLRIYSHWRHKLNKSQQDKQRKLLEEAGKQLAFLTQNNQLLQSNNTQAQTICRYLRQQVKQLKLKARQEDIKEMGRQELLIGNLIQKMADQELTQLSQKLTCLLLRIPKEIARREEEVRQEAKAKAKQQREQAAMSRDKTCVVCLEHVAVVLFLPCRHMKTCQWCCQALKHCPLCRAVIAEKFVPF
eukprot:gb/GEZN01018891.1/.p1 GENE.gb/GEZN01018891.1/~~gb/GEZN01018891.1/.p1  ORF type:complete len:232 (+),score=40.88 gb/GEZN01018891.1/:45-698(+)